MRQRAISAAVLVPVLLVVLALGGVVLAAAVALITVLAAMRGLPAAARRPVTRRFAALGTVLALVVVLDAAFPKVLEGSGLLLVAVGIVLVAVASFTRIDPRDGLAAWMATVFGALYVALLAFIVRLGQAAPAVPDGAPLASLGARTRLDPPARPRRLVVRHRRLPRRQELRADEVPDPHLAVEDHRRARSAGSSPRRSSSRSCCGASARTRSTRSCSAR